MIFKRFVISLIWVVFFVPDLFAETDKKAADTSENTPKVNSALVEKSALNESGAKSEPKVLSQSEESDTPSLSESTPSRIQTVSKEETEPKLAPNMDLSEVAPLSTLIEQAEPLDIEDPDSQGEDDLAPLETKTHEEVNVETAPQKNAVDGKAKSFVMLGAEVQPATATRLSWSPGVAISGLSAPTPVLVINGAKSGPTLCLTGAVHGDELNGIEIVRRVMYDIDPEKLQGKLIGIPIVNMQGFQRGSRYLPDRRDLNRYFPGDPSGSLASRIAHSLFAEVISSCDMLVDLHTGSLGRTNLPQIRADMKNTSVAAFTEGFDKMVVVHSTGSEGMLRTAASRAGITSVTMEVGESLRVQESDIRAGAKSIYSLMDKQGMYSRRFVWGKPSPVYYTSFWMRVETGGLLLSKIALGDTVSEGKLLGTVTDPITNETSELRAPSSGRIIGMAVDQFVMPGFAAYHIGQVATEETIVEPPLPESGIAPTEVNSASNDIELD